MSGYEVVSVCGDMTCPGNWNPSAYIPVCQKEPGHDGDHHAQDYVNGTLGWPGPRWPSEKGSRP